MKQPVVPPDPSKILAQLAATKDQNRFSAVFSVRAGMGADPADPYEHWDKVRFKPTNGSLSAEEVWAGIKLLRLAGRRPLPFADKHSQPLYFTQIGDFQRALHEIDSNARGMIGMPGGAATSESRDVYLQKSLVEEPFSSSVLEGAATTREVAKKMIEEGRAPRTVSERMVLNNYQAMNFIREHRVEPFTVARILELHRILTADTLERPEKVGVFRSTDDDVRVVESITGETLHMPPPAEELQSRLQLLCDFANEPSTGKSSFLHPVIRAIILHFMLAYDHPFWDGNGRSARALFYWCVLKHGYWLLEYISISAVIRRAPVKYGLAFLYCETDQGDLTYFINHQLDVVEKSLSDLEKYLVTKSNELSELGKALGALERLLSRRQLSVVQEALKRPSSRFLIAEHAKAHGISYLTARSDLERLAGLKLLSKSKEGTVSVYGVPATLQERVKRWSMKR